MHDSSLSASSLRQPLRSCAVLLSLLHVMASTALAQATGAGGGLRVEASTNGFDLVIDPVLTPGQLSVHRSGALRTLASNPEILLQTNTPFPQTLRVPLPRPGLTASQAFFQTALRPEAAILIAATNIPPSGGRIVAPANGPLAGLVLDVPANAYPEGRHFTLSYTPLGNGQLSEFATPIGPLIHVDNGGVLAEDYMSLTIPARLASDEVAVASLLDAQTGARVYVPALASTNDTVTILTRHFSGVSLEKMPLAKLLSMPPVSSAFSPGVDDWDFVNNPTFAEPRGQCYAMCQSAIWYFQTLKRRQGPLHDRFQTIPQGFATPKIGQDDVFGLRFTGLLQRESIDAGWDQMDRASAKASWYQKRDIGNFVACYLRLRSTGQPQLICFSTHAVVAYAADASGIYVADPNTLDRTEKIKVSLQMLFPTLAYRNSSGQEYKDPLLISQSVLSDAALLPQLWGQVEDGVIGQSEFPTFKIAVVEKQAGEWTEIGTAMTEPTETANHVIQARSGQVTISLRQIAGPPAYDVDWVVCRTNGTFTEGILPVPLDPGTNLLGVRVTAAPETVGARTDSEWAAFKWITVQTALPPVTKATFVIKSFAGTGWEGVAAPVTIVATVTKPGQTAFTGSNNKTERGNPPFSLSVPASADRLFYPCGTVTGFPAKPGGPAANRPGASSFIATAGGQQWICASAGAYRINGSTGLELNWEYQLRYVPKDPATGKPKLQIGTLTNIDAWAGFEIPEGNYTLQVE